MLTVAIQKPYLGYVILNLDPVAFRLGALEIRWYGLAYVLAASVGLWATLRYADALRVSRNHVWQMFLGAAPAAVLGARLYYVLQQPDLVDHYLKEPLNLVAFWNGGVAAFGAIFLAMPLAAIIAWRTGLTPWLGLDMTAFFCIVGQIFGRLGNLVNGDVLGYPAGHPAIPYGICQAAPCLAYVVDLHIVPWAIVYLHPGSLVPAHGIPYQPAAMYEIIFAMITFALVWPVRLILPQRVRAGAFLACSLGLYSIGQFVVFYTRSNVFVSFLGITTLKQAQWTALFTLLGISALYALVVRRFAQPWKAGQSPTPSRRKSLLGRLANRFRPCATRGHSFP